MKSRHKGQVAIEYLMTYGWVLIAIFVVIALIIASGVFSPGRFLKQECRLTPDFPCLTPGGQQANNQYKVMTNISNGLGYNITVQDVVVTDSNTGAETTISPGILVTPGGSILIEAVFDGNAANEMRTFYITLNYAVESGSEYQVSGRIRARIEPS